jgi:hypothetical protein
MAGGALTSVLAHLRPAIAGSPVAERSYTEVHGRFLDCPDVRHR